jgi:D-serine deaminase-like pyridoxal phosphate-dependent protein
MDDWYKINFNAIDSPALIIDRDKVDRNIEKAIEYAGGVNRLRPHVKTHKLLEVALMQIDAGIHKFKCATIPEAEMLGMAKAQDVLIAYPVQGPKIERVIKLMTKYPATHFSVLVDNKNSAEDINAAGKAANRRIDVFIDLNNGQFRTGIKLEEVPDLVEHCKSLEYLRIIGLHCYDGHIRMSSLEERTEACRSAFEPVQHLRVKIEKSLDRNLIMVAGGSPSFSVHRVYHDVECSPGTFIFWDQRYGDDYPELEFEKAAVLATRVISKLDAHTYCLDLGHKSVASESPFPRVEFLHAKAFEQIGHSEEHLVLKSKDPDVLSPGELLLAYPYHICPTVALYDHVNVVQKGQLVDQWRVIARDRKINI